jgi:hypothetical protein
MSCFNKVWPWHRHSQKFLANRYPIGTDPIIVDARSVLFSFWKKHVGPLPVDPIIIGLTDKYRHLQLQSYQTWP